MQESWAGGRLGSRSGGSLGQAMAPTGMRLMRVAGRQSGGPQFLCHPPFIIEMLDFLSAAWLDHLSCWFLLGGHTLRP